MSAGESPQLPVSSASAFDRGKIKSMPNDGFISHIYLRSAAIVEAGTQPQNPAVTIDLLGPRHTSRIRHALSGSNLPSPGLPRAMTLMGSNGLENREYVDVTDKIRFQKPRLPPSAPAARSPDKQATMR